MLNFLNDPSFYFALIVFIGLTHQKRFFKPLKKSSNQYRRSVAWGIALIVTILFFWKIFVPVDVLMFYLCPLVFFIILIPIISVNIRRTLYALHILLAHINDTETPTTRYDYMAVATHILIWVVVLSLPFGFTYESWHLDKYWDDYQIAVQLSENAGWDEVRLPPEYAHLTSNGYLLGIPFGDPPVGQTYFKHNDDVHTLYCRAESCTHWLDETNDDVFCILFRAPYWYRCAIWG